MVYAQERTKVVKLERSFALYADIALLYEAQLPVFFQPWWLNKVVGIGKWQPWAHENGLFWPILVKKKGPFFFCTQAPFMQSNAWFSVVDPDLRPDINALQKQFKSALYWQFNAGCHQQENLENAGFTIRSAFTYRIPTDKSIDVLWKQMNTLSRRNIQKAEKHLYLQTGTEVTALHHLSERSMHRHQLPMRFSENALQEIAIAANEKEQGLVYNALDADGQAHASGLFIWDAQALYFLIGGMDERLPAFGASRFLLWKGILEARERGLQFDFHGGMTPSVGQVYASMGGQKTNYCRVERYRSPFLKIAVRTAKKIYAPNDRLFH